MDDQELERLVNDLEADRIERKSAIANDKDKICEAICAFANDLPNNRKPGVLFVGVNDDGTCANLPIDDRLLLSLSDLRSNGNILPYRLALIKHYRSLMPLAQEARKPMFYLKPADGAIGAHTKAVQDAYFDFRSLAYGIALQTNIPLSTRPLFMQ